jgi:nuclear transport factor 2 (NTF2) superfamily protein
MEMGTSRKFSILKVYSLLQNVWTFTKNGIEGSSAYWAREWKWALARKFSILKVYSLLQNVWTFTKNGIE